MWKSCNIFRYYVVHLSRLVCDAEIVSTSLAKEVMFLVALVSLSVCLSVCLFVCLWTILLKKL